MFGLISFNESKGHLCNACKVVFVNSRWLVRVLEFALLVQNLLHRPQPHGFVSGFVKS